MWIMTNKGFVSIVDKSEVPGCLMVRARRPGHIKNLFPSAKVRESFGTDYRYRADIPRYEAASVIAREIAGIGYSNFKDSVKEKAYHDALMGVWHELGDLQPGGPYSRRNEPVYGGRRKRRWAREPQDLFDGGDFGA